MIQFCNQKPSSYFQKPTTTTKRVPLCSQLPSLIVISASNTTILTTALNNAIATWNATEQANIKGYNKRVQVIIWNPSKDVDYDTPREKLIGIATVFSGYTGNAARKALLYEVSIDSWGGTIKDFVACVNTLYGTNFT
jgi:hypothetical protein